MTDDVTFEQCGCLGLITLNRPRVLNVLSTAMCAAMNDALIRWSADPEIQAVVIQGAGDKAFCAGGDVKSLAENGPQGASLAMDFFATEYALNSRIFHFPKPYIALLDGIVMGGGVGVSVHGSHRIISEKSVFAMPESAIGLIPDVGGSYFLPRLPGKIGLYLGLVGGRLTGADILYAGVGTAYVPSARIPALLSALAKADIADFMAVDRVIAPFAESPGDAPLDEYRDLIDAAFGEDNMADILDHLAAIDHKWAVETLAALQTKSPTSLKVTFEQLRRGRRRDFKACLQMEYDIVSHIVSTAGDFYEGVRALLIDRDQAPRWNPPDIAAVSEDRVMAHFQKTTRKELIL